MTITEFLLARIEEDEAVARAAIRSGDGSWTAGEQPDPDGDVYDPCGVYGDDLHIYDEGGHDENHAEHIARHDPARVLAECAAKRAIIAQADEATGLDMSVDNDRLIGSRDEVMDPYCGDVILRVLAAVYASHPDFEQGWAL